MRIGINFSSLFQSIRTGGGAFSPRALSFSAAGRNARSADQRGLSVAAGQLQPRVLDFREASIVSATDTGTTAGPAGVYAEARRAIDRLRELVLGKDAGADGGDIEAAIERALSALSASTTYRADVTGRNTEQISDVEVIELDDGASLDIAGEVTRTGEAARLRLEVGAQSAQLDATFRLRGSGGSATISVSAGESLASIAEAVEDADVGVVAEIEGDGINLISAEAGSAAVVGFELLAAGGHRVDGQNLQQVSDFAVASFNGGTPNSISGEFQADAAEAELHYTGSAGAVAGTVEFDLVGNLGSAHLSLTEGESLAAAAARVNALSGATGIVAETAGDDLVLRSQSAGAGA